MYSSKHLYPPYNTRIVCFTPLYGLLAGVDICSTLLTFLGPRLPLIHDSQMLFHSKLNTQLLPSRRLIDTLQETTYGKLDVPFFFVGGTSNAPGWPRARTGSELYPSGSDQGHVAHVALQSKV